MKEYYYTDEKNAQVIVSLLKEYGIKRVIASPGTTNMALVMSMQKDPFFEMYSSVDERAAAYIACGLAAETGEPVVISCTGATASRNYLSGLTEAYYRKLPILAITSGQANSKVGHNVAQVIDRSSIQKDVAKFSVSLPIVKDDDDLWECEISVNKAILELRRHGGGPVHINLPTTYSKSYSTKELPKFRVISRITFKDKFPELKQGTKVAIFVGSHSVWSEELTATVDQFCATYDSVVFCDHTSNYKGKYRLLYSLVAGQQMSDRMASFDTLIFLGDITGDYFSLGISSKQVWRVSEDGEIRDISRKLRYVFEMPEETFFKHYLKSSYQPLDNCFKTCKKHLEEIQSNIPDLPFSNIWMASRISQKIPQNATLHFGILNSLRAWNFFEIPYSVQSSSNVGGFGIDGNVSSLLGASFSNRNKLFFGIVGDLAFFYDMNTLGNRHLGNNLRILLVNNGRGTEFMQYNHPGDQFGRDADLFLAAGGHFGNKSPELVKNYAENLGFDYLSAFNKEEFDSKYESFVSAEITQRPILFEVFTDSDDESKALEMILNIEATLSSKAKLIARQVLGDGAVNKLKKFLR